MSDAAYYKRLVDRLEGDVSRARSTYHAAIREYEGASGPALDRLARRILDAEGQLNRLTREFDAAKDQYNRAKWAEIRGK